LAWDFLRCKRKHEKIRTRSARKGGPEGNSRKKRSGGGWTRKKGRGQEKVC